MAAQIRTRDMDWNAVVVLAAVLLAAVWADATKRTIPNPLIVGGLASGLVFAATTGWQAFWLALAGMAVGFLIFLPAYVWAGMGAGDVKLMAAIGTFVGPKGAALAALASLIAGAMLGLLLLLTHGGVRAFARRYRQMFHEFTANKRFRYIPAAPREAASQPLPYALAIAVGTFWLLWHQGGWSMFTDRLQWVLS